MIQTAYKETYRPQYHFTPKTNWTNDPNGIDLLQRRISSLLSTQPIWHQLGQHDVGTRC